MQELWLSNNQIGDAGMIKFSEACATGALANCRELYLSDNKIGDPGMVKFSEALATGAMASITFIDLDHNKATAAGKQAKQAMRDVAKARGFRVDLA